MAKPNYFAHGTAARRYADARPYFHPLVMDRISNHTGRPRFGTGLDVACGTGQSTRALAAITDRVTGTDIAADMLAEAPALANATFHCAAAEALPFADASFDIVTVSLAFHWFDQARFMAEASRVLRPDGWLIVYSNGFTGHMRENDAFRSWAWDTYSARYPTPARSRQTIDQAFASEHGFSFSGHETYDNDISMKPDELVAYLLTQSNVIAAVEQGQESVLDVAGWLIGQVQPLFEGPTGTMRFSGAIWYLCKGV